jgi:hypothetical protein
MAVFPAPMTATRSPIGGLGAHEVIEAKQHVATRLARDAQRLCAPGARADEDRVIAITEEVGDGERGADGGVVPDPDAEGLQNLLVAVEYAFGQAVLGDAVAHDTTEARVLVEDRDGDAHLRKPHGRDDAGGAATDDGRTLAGGLGLLKACTLEIGARYVVLDCREVDGRTLAAAHAVALALGTVVADERADGAHGVVLEEHRARLVHPALAEQLDYQRNSRADRATLLAEGPLAVKAALCLFDDVKCHVLSHPSSHTCILGSLKIHGCWKTELAESTVWYAVSAC